MFHVDRWQQCWDTPSVLLYILHPQHGANTTKSISVVVLLVSLLLETNNKLKNSIPWLLTVMCTCVFNYVHVQTPLVAWAMAARFKYCTVALKFKERFPELFFFPLCSFLHIPFPLSMGSLAAILKLEHRNTGWTRRTNSSHALWLLGSMLFNTWVLERCVETAFLVINRANAGFHLDYLNMQWYLSVRTALVWSITRSRLVFCFIAVRTPEETDKNSHVIAHRDWFFGLLSNWSINFHIS